MGKLFRNIQAEFLKIKRRKIVLLHFLLSVPIMILLMVHQNSSIYPLTSRLLVFAEVFAFGAPFAAALASSMVVGAEEESEYKDILSGEDGRWIKVLAKLIVLYIMGTLAFLSTVVIFYVNERISRGGNIDINILVGMFMVFAAGILVQYAIGIFVTMKWGKTSAVICGAAGSLVGALMITGLGDSVWRYIPFAWIPKKQMEIATMHYFKKDILEGILGRSEDILMMAGITVAAFIVLFIWIRRWEGRKNLD